MAVSRRWRIFFWALEVLVLLVCLEQFVLKPRWEKRHVSKPVRKVSSSLAPLEGLADGSASARLAQESVSRETGLPIEVANSFGMSFRLIPAGTCLIGSERSVVEAQHVVEFHEHFYMGMHEVTQDQWKAVMGEESNPSRFKGRRRPVEEVTWYDCQRFVLKLAELEGVPAGTYRLPTEAEWEYACRAGTLTEFCFGDDENRLADYAEFAGNNGRMTAEVGGKLPNGFGLYDMHGNVWEWCLDDYRNYPGDDSPQSEANQYPVIRGGNWYVHASECRSAVRARLPAASHGNMLGFRIIRQIDCKK